MLTVAAIESTADMHSIGKYDGFKKSKLKQPESTRKSWAEAKPGSPAACCERVREWHLAGCAAGEGGAAWWYGASQGVGGSSPLP